jgi:hypothetical protein
MNEQIMILKECWQALYDAQTKIEEGALGYSTKSMGPTPAEEVCRKFMSPRLDTLIDVQTSLETVMVRVGGCDHEGEMGELPVKAR